METKETIREELDSLAAQGSLATRNAGLMAQYFVVGVVSGGLPATMYGVFGIYLNVPGYVYGATGALCRLPWSFKMFLGALHDNVPVRGLRRSPYMALGWSVCGAALLALAAGGLPDPYWCADSGGHYVTTCDTPHSSHPACVPSVDAPRDRGGEAAAAPCNAAAAAGAGWVTWLMFVATLGYVCADVAADGLTATLAMREPIESRGTIQSSVYLCRQIGMMLSSVIVGFGMNGPEYGGSFARGLSFEAVCLVFALPALAMAPASLLLVPDLPVSAPLPPLRSYLAGVWRLLCSRFFFSLIAYGLTSTTLGSVASPAGIGVMRHWCEVQNLPRQMFGLAGRGLFAVGLALTRAYLINANWRTTIAATTLAMVVIDVPFTACAVFDIIRSQYFLLGEEFLVEIPAAVHFLMTTFVVVEAADEENVGLVYGLLTSASNLGGSLSPLLSNQLFGRFEPSLSDSANFIEDAPSFRALVFSSFVLGYVFSLLSLCALPLLPAQKADAQARKRAWSSSTAVGWLSAGCFGAAFCYGLTLSVLTLFPRTACLELVGGSGCVRD